MTGRNCVGVVALALLPIATNAQDRALDLTRSPLVLQGCLGAAERAVTAADSAPGTTLTPATPPGGGTGATTPLFFALVDARPVGRSTPAANAGGPVGTGGTARTRNADGSVTADPDDQAAAKTYVLDGNQGEFAARRGHWVEVSGTIMPAPIPNPPVPPVEQAAAANGLTEPSAERPIPAAPDRSESAPAPAAPPGLERLTVASIRTIAESCAR